MKLVSTAVVSIPIAALQRAARGGARWNARRDVEIIQIHQDTSEIQRLVIARNETGPR
jgi:alkylation response protein AidB-like acyl-CoA dehydrogenase